MNACTATHHRNPSRSFSPVSLQVQSISFYFFTTNEYEHFLHYFKRVGVLWAAALMTRLAAVSGELSMHCRYLVPNPALERACGIPPMATPWRYHDRRSGQALKYLAGERMFRPPRSGTGSALSVAPCPLFDAASSTITQ
jgi:hypothetical protein